MLLDNADYDDRMTAAHKEKLEEWHLSEIDKLLDELLETDAGFRASMEALNIADRWDISDLAYDLAGDVAKWAAEGLSEEEWFSELPTNTFLQRSLALNLTGKASFQIELFEAIEILRLIELWPWARS